MRHFSLLLAGALGLLLAACGQSPDSPEAKRQAARELAAQQAFATGLQAWRAQRTADLTRPDGWASLVGLHWIEPGPHYLGSSAGNGIRLAMGPAHVGMLDLMKNGEVRFVPEPGVALTVDAQPLAGAVVLRSDATPAGASALGFDEGKGLATVIKRGDRFALRVKHADAPTRTGFGGLEYWPSERSWQVPGRFVAHPAGKTLPIANIIGITDNVPNPGAIEFERDGKPYRLEALDEGDGQLFLVFADRTSGHGSYGAGRFLDAELPDPQGRVMLDFNRAYNPPCAFTPFATCPLPPPENRLDLAIAAGEKAYHPSKGGAP